MFFKIANDRGEPLLLVIFLDEFEIMDLL